MRPRQHTVRTIDTMILLSPRSSHNKRQRLPPLLLERTTVNTTNYTNTTAANHTPVRVVLGETAVPCKINFYYSYVPSALVRNAAVGDATRLAEVLHRWDKARLLKIKSGSIYR